MSMSLANTQSLSMCRKLQELLLCTLPQQILDKGSFEQVGWWLLDINILTMSSRQFDHDLRYRCKQGGRIIMQNRTAWDGYFNVLHVVGCLRR